MGGWLVLGGLCHTGGGGTKGEWSSGGGSSYYIVWQIKTYTLQIALVCCPVLYIVVESDNPLKFTFLIWPSAANLSFEFNLVNQSWGGEMF